MEEKDRTLGLRSVVSISVGLVIATSCLVSLGQGAGSIGVVFIGAMVIACLLNMTTVASLSELNALMPNTTGGLAQYTLACMGPFPTLISMVGGYLICNIMSSGVEHTIRSKSESPLAKKCNFFALQLKLVFFRIQYQIIISKALIFCHDNAVSHCFQFLSGETPVIFFLKSHLIYPV